MTDAAVPRLLTVKQLAEASGIPRWRWYQLFASGEGPAFLRVGKTIRVTSEAFARWIEAQEAASAQPEDEESTY